MSFEWEKEFKAMGFSIELTPEQIKTLDDAASHANTENGLTPTSSFGEGIILDTIRSFKSVGRDAENIMELVQKEVGVHKPPTDDNTPVGRLMKKRGFR